MAFFFSNVLYDGVMVVGWRDGQTKAGKPFTSLTVADASGNSNQLSTSEPETMNVIHGLSQGDVINLRIVVAGGPQKQYAMIARGSESIQLVNQKGY